MKNKIQKLLEDKYVLKNTSFKTKYVWVLVCISVVMISIGYGALNEELNISGEAAFRPVADIRITDIRLNGVTNGGIEDYNSNYSKNSIMTGITLPNVDSTISYNVTVTNISNITMKLKDIMNTNFNNLNMEYKITGIGIDALILEMSEITFEITFKYKSSVITVPENRILESIIQFVFVPYDNEAPVISEVKNVPKIYYITQTNNIDLTKYATAFDNIDGDVTDKITITSSPEFNKNNSGTYQITYSVQDKAGNVSAPLKITIVIWNFSKVEAGSYHALALTSHGRVYGWGYNIYGGVGNGSTGSVNSPIQLNLKDVVDIAATEYTSYAVTSDGKIYSWGDASNGQLGNGSSSNRSSPGLVTIPSETKFVKIDAQISSVAAVTDSGDVYTWGYNNVGQLGDGTTTTRTVPTKINVSNIVEISQGADGGAAINKDGVLYTWGNDDSYLLGDNTNRGKQNLPNTYSNLTNMKFVKVCRYHVIAISKSGQVYTWGNSGSGQLGSGGTNVSRIPYATSITNGEQASRLLGLFIS